MTLPKAHRSQVPYKRIAAAALPHLPQLLARRFPDGRRTGDEWVARNPTRDDSTLGSFKINMRTGRWADFATGDKGGDAISLLAYLDGTSQSKAARRLTRLLDLPF